jgi:hypothetical protein
VVGIVISHNVAFLNNQPEDCVQLLSGITGSSLKGLILNAFHGLSSWNTILGFWSIPQAQATVLEVIVDVQNLHIQYLVSLEPLFLARY